MKLDLNLNKCKVLILRDIKKIKDRKDKTKNTKVSTFDKISYL